MDLGKPCYFLEKGLCGIYETRPVTCRDYVCHWRQDDSFPDWMKPNVSNMIVDVDHMGIEFHLVRVVQCADIIDSRVIEFVSEFVKSQNKGIFLRSPFRSRDDIVKQFQRLGCSVDELNPVSL